MIFILKQGIQSEGHFEAIFESESLKTFTTWLSPPRGSIKCAWFFDPFKIDESSNYGEVLGADSKSEIHFGLSYFVTEIWSFKVAKFVTLNGFLRFNSKTQHDTQKITSDLESEWSILLRPAVWSHSETLIFSSKMKKTSKLTPCSFLGSRGVISQIVLKLFCLGESTMLISKMQLSTA